MGEEIGNWQHCFLSATPDVNRGPVPQMLRYPAPDRLSVVAPPVVPPFVGILQSLSQIDEAPSLAETVSVTRQLLNSTFPRTPFFLGWCSEAGEGFSALDRDGVLLKEDGLSPKAVAAFLGTQRVRRPIRLKGALRRLFGGGTAGSVTSFPFVAGGAILGFLCLFDCELQTDELLVVELIACQVAAKLLQLGKEREQAEQSELSVRMMGLADSLLRSQNKEELYGKILDGAVDLTGACQGSVMLIDADGQHLQAVQARGMGSEIARQLRLPLGEGIAGVVARRGGALLIRDVENDPRTARRNRPRFKSKSLVSIPLKLNDKVLGVLNLSDKADLKDFSEADLKLLTAFSIFASLMIERSQNREKTYRLERLSCTDPLTGTYNRRFLDQRLEEEINRSKHQGLEFTLLFIDLDHFKGYNDRFGHLAGDEALVKVAQVVKSALRDMDTLARFGGEEFCVLLPGTSKHLGQLVAERIRLGVALEMFPGAVGLRDGRLTASLGVATFPEDGVTVTSLLKASDGALYQAKAGGRNRIVAVLPVCPSVQWPTYLPA